MIYERFIWIKLGLRLYIIYFCLPFGRPAGVCPNSRSYDTTQRAPQYVKVWWFLAQPVLPSGEYYASSIFSGFLANQNLVLPFTPYTKRKRPWRLATNFAHVWKFHGIVGYFLCFDLNWFVSVNFSHVHTCCRWSSATQSCPSGSSAALRY